MLFLYTSVKFLRNYFIRFENCAEIAHTKLQNNPRNKRKGPKPQKSRDREIAGWGVRGISFGGNTPLLA